MTKTEFTVEPGQPSVTVTREFRAPRALLFRAYTEPELLARWLGPRGLEMEVDRFEVRDGGRYRYIHRGEDGVPHAFHGVFHGEPTAERGIVQTFEYEGTPGHVALDSVTFEERDGRTTLRLNSVFQTVEARDQHVGSGMEVGVRDSMERLAELLDDLG
jgi:uncharacterized protein YndB with AHSA1/START domain